MIHKINHEPVRIFCPLGKRILQIGISCVSVHVVGFAVIVQIEVGVRSEVVNRFFGKALIGERTVGKIGSHLGGVPEVVPVAGTSACKDNGFVFAFGHFGFSEDLNAIVAVLCNIYPAVRADAYTSWII